MLVGRQMSSPLTSSRAASAIVSRLSLRRRIAASLPSRTVSSGSLGKRTASSRARTSWPAARDARRSTGRWVAVSSGTIRLKYGQAPGDGDADAGGRGGEARARSRRSRPRARRGPPWRSARRSPVVSSSVTTCMWSGGTTTSTSLSRTIRRPSSRCCSRRAAVVAAARLEPPVSPLDELVDAASCEGGRRRAGDDLPARQRHVSRRESTSTSSFSMRLRSPATWL